MTVIKKIAGNKNIIKSAVSAAALCGFLYFENKCLTVSEYIAESFFDEENKPQRKFCTWEEIRPFIFSVIKGSKLPKHMKIVLSAPEELRNNLCENASALFINVNYENNVLTLITGYSLKTFSLNKDHEIIWDNYVEGFIKENNISVSTQL